MATVKDVSDEFANIFKESPALRRRRSSNVITHFQRTADVLAAHDCGGGDVGRFRRWCRTFVAATSARAVADFFRLGDDRGPLGFLSRVGELPRDPPAAFFSSLNVKGKSAKVGRLSGFVPFVQIHAEEHKARVGAAAERADHRLLPERGRVAKEAGRRGRRGVLAETQATSKKAELMLQAHALDDLAPDVVERVLKEKMLSVADPRLVLHGDYAPGAFGVDMPGAPTATIRSLNPVSLLVAYAEARVLPVASDMDAFLFGSRGVVPEQLRATRPSAATACGAVRHGAECYNLYFPQELDDEYLVVWDGFPGGFSYVDEPGLRRFLLDRASRLRLPAEPQREAVTVRKYLRKLSDGDDVEKEKEAALERLWAGLIDEHGEHLGLGVVGGDGAMDEDAGAEEAGPAAARGPVVSSDRIDEGVGSSDSSDEGCAGCAKCVTKDALLSEADMEIQSLRAKLSTPGAAWAKTAVVARAGKLLRLDLKEIKALRAMGRAIKGYFSLAALPNGGTRRKYAQQKVDAVMEAVTPADGAAKNLLRGISRVCCGDNVDSDGRRTLVVKEEHHQRHTKHAGDLEIYQAFLKSAGYASHLAAHPSHKISFTLFKRAKCPCIAV
ncbi:hypothetical protein SO694_00130032 [Aureococcus anophagefferens]|uniref:Uncharacterized protein n=1 Tax=Aureococcus anophagefferens TaxID=44056 RepID=A0ABR1GFX4_AURAN